MKKITLFVHCSLDGIAVSPDRGLDWIYIDDVIFEFAGNMTAASDVALYGRKTYEIMEAYWPTAADQPNASRHDREHAAWYKSVHKVVMSRSLQGHHAPDIQVIGQDLPREINALKQLPGSGNILMLGSPTASHALADLGMIDDYWLFVNSVVLSEGIPVFRYGAGRKRLHFVESHPYTGGVVALHYTKAD